MVRETMKAISVETSIRIEMTISRYRFISISSTFRSLSGVMLMTHQPEKESFEATISSAVSCFTITSSETGSAGRFPTTGDGSVAEETNRPSWDIR
ncbi:hypothetical protein D3C73_1245900 [compost metagenome]